MTLWRTRLAGESAEELWAFSRSIHFDVRLAADDIAGSRAHVGGLERAGILTAQEGSVLLAALGRVEEELNTSTFKFLKSDEDIHTAIERRVTELSGDVGPKLHTGRSRNDQVATDLRLYTKRALGDIGRLVVAMQRTLYDRAKSTAAAEVYLPGYTHLQRAQPVLLAHHLLAHGWALARDVDRLLDCRHRLDVSPLGAGALAGSSLKLDPAGTARDLGFAEAFENSLDAVADRDFVAEALFAIALLGVHLSRLGEEIVLWTSAEFGFMHLDDAWATGSSMLPQKKNPDVAELARGKAGRLIGHVSGFLSTLKGLPFAYNRDLQEDKEPLFDAVDQISAALSALTGLVATATFDADRMAAAADSADASAVDLTEFLVERGVAFRTAYGVVANLVRDAAQRHVPLAELVEAHPSLGAEALAMLEPGVAVRRRTSPGAAGPRPVADQLRHFRDRLATAEERLNRL
jgi:argininosuccinate lyase